MRRILRFATARTVLSAVVMIAFAGAVIEESSSYAVSDAKAATLTGGACNSNTTSNGTISCLSTMCPQLNLSVAGGGTSCVITQNCGSCQCTFAGPMCNN